MAKFNVAALIGGVQKALDAVNEMSPVIAALGGPIVANVATIGIAATGVIMNVLERTGDAKVALSTQDEAKLRAMLEELQAANDKLAGAVQAS